MIRSPWVATVAAGLVMLSGALAFAAEPVVEHLSGTVRTADQPAPRVLEITRVDGVDYVDLRFVARLFHATKYWRAELEKMVLKIEGHRVRLTVGSPYVFVDEAGSNLLAPVRWEDDQIIVPMVFVTDVVNSLVSESVHWNRRERLLSIGTGEPNILGVDFDVRQNGTVVELRLGEMLDGTVEFPRQDRVLVRVPRGVLRHDLRGGMKGLGLIDSLETAQTPAEAVITLHLGPYGGTAEVLRRTSPPRLLIAVSEGTADDIPLPDFERRAAPRPRQVRVVVIDPGHGGSDPGIVTTSGVAEKEITLAIAQYLRRRLQDEDESLRVILTRDDDRFLSNEDRTGIANSNRADLFISLHGNGWFHGGERGFSVGTFSGDGAHAPSEFARWGEPDPGLQSEMSAFAETLLEALGESVPLPNRGARSAGYAVLAGATMPAVLVECGFLTNREDAGQLVDSDFQETVASALAQGVLQFRDSGGTP